MSRKYLGETFDIHGGGQDLIFPHHENEIAQSCGATDAEFAKVWMHHGFVTIRDEKMSKSLGNFLTIRDVRAQYEPEVLRLFIFSTQYRNPLDFTETALQDARAGLERLYDCLARLDALPASGPAGEGMIAGRDRTALETLAERFTQAMDNDFNTAQALGHLFDAVKTAGKVLRQLPDQPAAADLELLRATGATLRTLGGVLGILQQEPAGFVTAVRARMLAGVDLEEAEIEQLIDKRNRARADKDWATSDEVRDYLLAHGVALKDSPEGTTWEARER
jgi:cysteinyl-tRNA synthetase